MIRFLKYKWLYGLISIVVIAIGLFSLTNGGNRLSIDFTGGSVIQYQLSSPVEKDQLVAVFRRQKISLLNVDTADQKKYTIRSVSVDEKREALLRQSVEKELKAEVKLLRFETVGPTLGVETIRKTIMASIIAVVGIMLYLTFAFKKISYGAAAVLAMLHDLVVLVGMYAVLVKFFAAEFDTLFVTALLTTLSFSVHDTIVVFDKIREYRRVSTFNIEQVADKALTETMVRSINNSLTIMLMLVPLTLLGGETTRFFAAALLIGTVTGTYSSPFVATPILVLLEREKPVAFKDNYFAPATPVPDSTWSG